MSIEFKLPDLGEGVAEGEIIKWLVSEGQEIKEDQPMVEVMTDKATVQIPSPATGRVRQIVAKEGQTVKVGSTVVILDTDGAGNVAKTEKGSEKGVESIKTTASQVEQPTTQRQNIELPRRAIATPAVRKLARDLNLDIDTIEGTGPGGRVTEEDLRRAAAAATTRKQPPSVIATQQVSTEPTHPPTVGLSSALETAMRKVPQEMREERIPLHGIRRRTAEKMTKSIRTAAHVWHVDEVDYTELVELRNKAKVAAELRGVKLTYLPFIIKAAVLALKEFPYFNSTLDDEKQEIVVKHYYNIGFATDTPNGLIVPVVKDADKKSILDIAREIFQLSEDARNGKISLENIQGATFTITNIGTLGGIFAMPIINHPEVAILGVLKIEKRPVVWQGQIVARDIGYISLGFDHRVVDGADAARFTSRIVEYLEHPSLMLLLNSI
jgi:pyruvate dehydrogenase E2 component (dihydrolipoamide acetyltransferase)